MRGVAVVVKSARLIFGDEGGGVLVVERDMELGFSGSCDAKTLRFFPPASRCPDLPVPLSNYNLHSTTMTLHNNQWFLGTDCFKVVVG